MNVYYKSNNPINGQMMSKESTQVQPKVSYSSMPNKLYALIMHDPYAVTDSGNYLHWVVTNISGSNIESGTTLLPYYGPHPPSNSGTHKYIFLLIEQPGKIDVSLKNSRGNEERTLSMKQLYERLTITKPKKIASKYFQVKSQIGGKTRRKTNSKLKRKTRTRK
jgi:phosphatidylethanolamine-binding protein (PEBP) family uncharacterized protein